MKMKTRMNIAITRATGNPFLFLLFRTHFSSNSINNVENCYDTSIRLENFIKTRCKSGSLTVNEALGFFNSMIQMRPIPSIWAFNHLLGALSKNHYSTVVYMYREIMGFGYFRPDICTMNILITCFSRLKKVEFGFSVLSTIVKTGLWPDVHTVGSLLHGLCEEGSMVVAMELFEEIVDKEHLCNDVVYVTMINGFCKVGETRKALELLTRMHNNEGIVKPYAGCYNPIIDSLCKKRRIGEALSLFRDMINEGVLPDVVCYNSLIHGLSKSGCWGEAKGLLIDMVDRGISPSVRTYTSLIDCLCKEGKTQEALSLFGLMIRKGIKPTVVTFTSLIDALCKSGWWKEAAQCLMNITSCGISPDITTSTAMLDLLYREGRTIEAFDIFEELTNRDLDPEVITYSSVIYGLCKLGQWKEAMKLLDEMKERAITPSVVTFNIVADALCKERRTKEALKLLKDMIEEGLVPDQAARRILKSILHKRCGADVR